MKRLYTVLIFMGLLAFVAQSLDASSPRRLLVEEYTSAYCGACGANAPKFISDINSLGDKVVPMCIHVSYGDGDPFYKHNTKLTQRVSLYLSGSYGIPAAWVVGAKAQSVTTIPTEVNKYYGQMSPLSIYVIEDRDKDNNITATVVVQSDEALTGNKQLFVGVIEKHIYYPNAGSNGETDFHWVARDILPSAYSGKAINIEEGKSMTYQVEIPFKSEWQANEIYLIAFVQDMDTKEVLQAAETSDEEFYAEISVDKNQLNFGKVADAGTLSVNVKNEGVKLLEVSNVTIEDDANGVFKLMSGSSFNVGYMDEYEVQVAFTPKENKPYTATLKIESNTESGKTKSISLIGTGEGVEVKPDIATSVEELDFGEVSESKTLSFDVTNTGFADLELGDMILEGSGRLQFEVVTKEFDKIAPNESATVEVMFKPKKDGDYTANLKIYSNVSVTKSVLLNGVGKDVVAVNPEITVSESSLDFLNVSTTKTMSFDITNSGNGELVINEFEIIQDDEVFFVTSELPDPIAQNESVEIDVEFRPFENASFDGILNIKSNAGNIAVKAIILMGKGEGVENAPKIVFNMTKMDFETTDQKKTLDLVIENSGTGDLEISSIYIEGNTEKAFTLESGSKMDPIGPSKTDKIVIGFDPKANKKYTAELTFNSNTGQGGAEETQKIPLEGIGDGINSVGEIDSENEYVSLSVAPNPLQASGNINLTYKLNVPLKVQIDLYDISGGLIKSIYNGTPVSGSNLIGIDDNGLNAGLYYIVATVNGQKAMTPVIIVK